MLKTTTNEEALNPGTITPPVIVMPAVTTIDPVVAPSLTVADLPRLLQALSHATDEANRAALLPPLTELLWGLRPEDDRFLNARGRRTLRAWVKRGLQVPTLSEAESDFMAAASKALATVADRKAIRVMWAAFWSEALETKAAVPKAAAKAAVLEFLVALEAEVEARAARRKELMEHLNLPIENGVNRKELEDALTAMGPEAARLTLRGIVEKHARLSRWRLKGGLWIAASFGALVIPYYLFVMMAGRGSVYSLFIGALLSSFLLCVGVVAMNILARRMLFPPTSPPSSNPLTRAARALTVYAGKEDLELLLNALQYGGHTLEVEDTVAKLLRDLTVEDAHWLSRDAQRYLEWLLREWGSMSLEMRAATVKALDALEHPDATP